MTIARSGTDYLQAVVYVQVDVVEIYIQSVLHVHLQVLALSHDHHDEFLQA